MRLHVTDSDEFLLSQLLDGTLGPAEAAALRTRMEREPDLRAAYDSLARVDRLLAARQADQPRVDLVAMRRQIMTDVAGPRVLSISRWLRVAAPLAAAAAIALVVSIYWPAVQPDQPLPDPRITTVTQPGPAQPGRLLVQYNRPEPAARGGGVLRVSYVQTSELAEAMRERDKEYRSRPTWHMYVAETGFSFRGGAGEVPPL